MSKAAQTHKLRKLRAPSKCRECDGLVVFHGAECEEVTLLSPFFLFTIIILISLFCSAQMNRNQQEPLALSLSLSSRWTLPKFHNGFFNHSWNVRNQTKTKEGERGRGRKHLCPHQNTWMKGGELNLATDSPQRPSPPTGLSRGTGQWKLKTFCLSSDESPLHRPYAPPWLFILDPVSFHIYYKQWTRQ